MFEISCPITQKSKTGAMCNFLAGFEKITAQNTKAPCCEAWSPIQVPRQLVIAEPGGCYLSVVSQARVIGNSDLYISCAYLK